MKIIEVTWKDSFHNSGPLDTDEIDDTPMELQLVGYFVKETPELLVIAGEYIGKDRWRRVDAITKSSIKRRRVVRK
jgi:hypothetical protein